MVEVIILPDHDKPGMEYANAVYQDIRSFLTNTKIQMLRFPLNEKADICDYLKTLPELIEWNEFDSLQEHPGRVSIRNVFDAYVKDHAEPIPADWNFIISPGRHKLIAANDFCRLTLPERKVLLGPWLTEGSINMVFADRGIGKTFFCLSCAIAIANGEGFLSYDAPAPAPVLYLDGEMQGAALQDRFRLLTNGMDTKAPIHIYTPDLQTLTDGTPDIGLDTGRIDINAMIELAKPKVVFIDNISTFIRTGNENEADSWAPVQEWAIQQRKKGIAVVFIHHANKEGKQRGSHKKEDVMDVVLQLKRPDDFIAGEDDTRLLVTYTKSRHLQAKETQDMEATLRIEGNSLQWSHTNGNPHYLRCIELVKDGIPYPEIAEELSVSKSTVSRWKKRAVSEGLI
jgi:putative DNA primase/helicase